MLWASFIARRVRSRATQQLCANPQAAGAGTHRRLSMSDVHQQQAKQRQLLRHLSATPAATPPLPDAAVPPGGGGAAPVSSAKDKDRGGPSGSAAGTDALPQAMGKGSAPAAAETKGSNRSGGSELWIVGRVLEDMDTRLGAKQEKIRKHEVGVIERYASVISALDDKLEAREGDDFVSWVSAQGLVSAPSEPEPEHAKDVKKGSKEGEGAGGRAKTESFLVSAAARLNSLVADQEDMLFRDRGGGEKGAKTETAAAEEEATAQGEVASPTMPEEDLYQARLAAHRAMLSHCLTILSASLGKQQLKAGLTVEEVAAAVRSAYLANPNERLGALFPLFDTHGDGHLDAESVERVVDAAVLPVAAAAERCYAAAARPVLDKKAAKAMPATMKYTLWDVLEVPIKRRCAFAWAENRKQVGPEEWRVSWEQFAPSRRQHFPELESTSSKYMSEYSKRRTEWHNSRKGRKRAAIYGSALFFGVLFLDNMLSIV